MPVTRFFLRISFLLATQPHFVYGKPPRVRADQFGGKTVLSDDNLLEFGRRCQPLEIWYFSRNQIRAVAESLPFHRGGRFGLGFDQINQLAVFVDGPKALPLLSLKGFIGLA